MELENNAYFWQKLDTLVLSSTMVIDHKKNTSHPNYPNLIYPVDYGYLKDDLNDNDDRISFFQGSEETSTVDSIVVCVDIVKEMKCYDGEHIENLKQLHKKLEQENNEIYK